MSEKVQEVKMSKSILAYFRMEMNFDNESIEYRKIKEQEFKDELTISLNTGVAKKKIRWVD